MKYMLSLIIPVLFLSLSAFNSTDRNTATELLSFQKMNMVDVEVPKDVKAVLDRSCLPCHGADGSGKAKMKWNWEKMSEYSKTKMISKLVKVSEKVDEGKMPPAKKVKKHPEMKLSPEDKDLLMSWADNTAIKLTGSGE